MRRAVAAAGVVALVALVAVPAGAQSPSPAADAPPPAVGAEAVILIDGRTGRMVYGKDVHTRRAMASLTKVMTALVARERYQLDELVTVGDEVRQVRGEKLGLTPGMQISVRDLLYGMLLLSGNDAAATLAAHDPLGPTHFVALMNAKARALGARDSAFANPHGLDEANHYSTPWDLALFARAVLADRVLAEIVASKTYPVAWTDGGTRVVQNHNKLLWRYPGTVGMKTGFTNDAGKCLIAVVRTEARRTAITVVMKSPDHYRDTTTLFDYFKAGPVAAAGAPVVATPKPTPLPQPARAAAAGPALRIPSTPDDPRDAYRWIALPMLLLATSMLLTVRRPRRRHPLDEAAEFHPYLEPLAVSDDVR